MRISLLRISLLRFFETITKIWLMRFFGLFIREFSPNANFISANFVNAVFQNFLDVFCYCDFMSILLMRFLVNAIFCAIYFVTAVIS
jgi:hypothetical protein